LSLALVVFCQPAPAAADDLPSYTCIQPNVDFWTKIYAEFDSGQGVLHDKYRLEIIYDVIELRHPDSAGNRKINRRRVDQAKAAYRSILDRFARGQQPQTETEKRVWRLFGDRSSPADFKSATGNLRCQVGLKDRFRDGIVRSGAHIEAIRRIFRDCGLPEALAYLPHVESSYHPEAHSTSGAAGIWQFTRAAGRSYLTITPEVDERWDPLAASRGAAELLRHNYRKFRSWPLAITAYNHGTAGVLEAVRCKGDYETIFREYRSRRFRFASRNFYAEFLAARQVAENYRTYFGELSFARPAVYREIELALSVSLPELADRLALDPEAISKLNPALRASVVKGHVDMPKGFKLRLPPPADRRRLAEMDFFSAAAVRTEAETGKAAPRSDDPPLAPALSARQLDWQTYGHTPVTEYVCPQITPAQFALARIVNDNGRAVGIVRVELEETLGHFAEWLEVPAREIRHLNGLSYGRPLRVSQRLKLPLERVSAAEFEARRRAFHEGLAEDFFQTYRIEGVATYVVRRGDTVWGLANERFNVPMWLIKRFNSDTDFSALTPALVLQIPLVARDA